MDAATRKRIEAERARALSEISLNTSRSVIAYNALPERKRRSRAQGLGIAASRPSHHPKAEDIARSIPHLLTPAPTAEALSSPARRRAEADGFAQFGKRTWFLVQKGEKFRAVESQDDAPGWSLVQEMKR